MLKGRRRWKKGLRVKGKEAEGKLAGERKQEKGKERKTVGSRDRSR